MRRLVIIPLIFITCLAAGAQSSLQVTSDGIKAYGDSLAVMPDSVHRVTVDSLLAGKSIFDVMPDRAKGDRATVTVSQPQAVRDSLLKNVSTAQFKAIPGWRIRIFFSNAQTAREESAAAEARFREKFSAYSSYREFVNPNFKVTVGDFRTKSDALRILGPVKREFPTAFIVHENILLRD